MTKSDTRIFICWHGEKSKRLGLALRQFIRDVIGKGTPFISAEDLKPSEIWPQKLLAVLAETAYGIVCATPAAAVNPWVNFEAGAILAAKLRGGCGTLWTCLLGLEQRSIPGPLGMIQSVRADTVEDVFKLVENVRTHVAPAIGDDQLAMAFESHYPEFEGKVRRISSFPDDDPKAERQASESMIEVGALEHIGRGARAQAWLTLLTTHHSEEWRELRGVIRNEFAPYMKDSASEEMPLTAREDQKVLAKKVERILNYYEGIGSSHRYGYFGEELLDLVHNSVTALWSAITQTDESDQRRFDRKYIDECFVKLRGAKVRGADYASDILYLAKQAAVYRAGKELRKKLETTGTGGSENPLPDDHLKTD